MPDFYFDRRENRIKPTPDCGRYGLTWNSFEQRCKHYDCVEQIMNVLDVDEDYWDQAEASRYQGWNGLGYLPSDSSGTGGGGGIPGIDPISAGIGIVTGVIGSLIAGAKQRGTDEAKSGAALQSGVESIYYFKNLVQSGRATKTQAYDAFYTKILPAFIDFIQSLPTKSVVDSRIAHQVPDLKALFQKEVMDLPDLVQSPPYQQPVDDEPLPDNTDVDIFGGSSDLGFTEEYLDDGGYYYEDESGWYYEDSQGNYQQQDSDGNLYAGSPSGEYWETDVDGTSYWEGSDGAYYQEYPDGTWISGDPLGNECTGDAVGNWTCEDGTGGGDWRESPARISKSSGQARRQQQIPQSTFDKYLKQAIALIPKQQRQATSTQRAQTAIGSRQAQNAQQRLLSANPKGSSSGSGLGSSGLITIAIVIGGLFVLKKVAS